MSHHAWPVLVDFLCRKSEKLGQGGCDEVPTANAMRSGSCKAQAEGLFAQSRKGCDGTLQGTGHQPGTFAASSLPAQKSREPRAPCPSALWAAPSPCQRCVVACTGGEGKQLVPVSDGVSLCHLAGVQSCDLSSLQPLPPGFKQGRTLSPRLECRDMTMAHCSLALWAQEPSSCLSLPKMGSHYIAQAGPKLLASSNPPTSASQNAGFTGMSHCSWPAYGF
ncbi:hypothetical protein AAY473_038469 [Plecturocebus cupreus]